MCGVCGGTRCWTFSGKLLCIEDPECILGRNKHREPLILNVVAESIDSGVPRVKGEKRINLHCLRMFKWR
jgi:hypothetical protein